MLEWYTNGITANVLDSCHGVDEQAVCRLHSLLMLRTLFLFNFRSKIGQFEFTRPANDIFPFELSCVRVCVCVCYRRHSQWSRQGEQIERWRLAPSTGIRRAM